MKKFHLLAAATILSTTSVFTSMPGTDVYAAKNVTTEGRKAIKQQEDVKRIADQFVESRYKIGDENWKAFKVSILHNSVFSSNDERDSLVATVHYYGTTEVL